MARPSRNADANAILSGARTFFVTTKTASGKRLLQSERNASLLIEVLRHYAREQKFEIHDFVVMPDHVHLLLTVDGETSIEKAVQFIKGGFSYRIKKDFGYPGDVWQKGFSEVRVEDRESYLRHREYIAKNPVNDGLVREGEEFAYCFTFLARQKAAGAKAPENIGAAVRQR
ncbi:REP-associated tyrosine transposase [Candidatus Korobacter versatilis]